MNKLLPMASAIISPILAAGAVVLAVHVYPPAVPSPQPIVQQASIDNEAIAEAVARRLMAAEDQKQSEARGKANSEWCRMVPGMASCR